jgi:ABC-type antimicrobial peptide transport system permease subunit
MHKFILDYDEVHVKANGHFAGRDYFNIFSYPLLEGNKNLVFEDKNSIVISETLSRSLFGTTENVIGKRIEWEIMGYKAPAQVTGIFYDISSSSSVQFDFVLTFDYFQDELVTYPYWSNNYAYTYLVLKEGTDTADFNQKIAGFIKTKQEGSNITLFLQPYSKRYLQGNYENGVVAGGRIVYVKLFSIIAIFILVIACINFMNLSTARASIRFKEIGIKKAIGAERKTLIMQFLGESVFMAVLALILAVIIAELMMPRFNSLTGKNIFIHYNIGFLLTITSITILTGLFAGSYPALFLSGFNPAKAFRGKSGSQAGELWTRKGLVVFQFTLSVMLITAVVIVFKQIEYVQTKNLGYSRDNIIYIEQEGKIAGNGETFINELKRMPGVLNASPSGFKIGSGGWTYGIQWEGMKPDEYIQFHEVRVGHDAIEMMGIEMAEGRAFSRDFPSDSSGIIFNQAAIDAMGMKVPVGKTVRHYQGSRQIVGITKNFQFESLYHNVKPLCFLFDPTGTNFIMIKLEVGKEKETIAGLQKFYESFNPGFTFDYKYLDQDYQALYSTEQKVGVLSRYFAGLALIISCLGLFGLAAFTAERRLKEISIRKILGSTEFGIIRLLSGDFTKMVLIAILIALPISYYFSSQWLDGFADRIELKPWYFAGAGIIALLIAWLTVGLQAVKAARVNPAQCLKEE